jgi:hypothetical protein
VPTLRSYVDTSGHYIRAWAPDVGNITYQVSTDANPILSDVGFESGDEIPWTVVSALRAAGLVYIGDGETDTPDGNSFDPDNQLEELCSETAGQLLSQLESLPTVGPDEVEEIERILNIDSDVDNPSTTRTEDLSQEVSIRCHELVRTGGYTSSILEQGDLNTFTVSRKKDREYRLRTNVADFNQSHGWLFIYYNVIENIGLDSVEVAVDPGRGDIEMDWEMRAEVHKLIADFLPIVTSALRHKNIAMGEPDREVSMDIDLL